MKIKMVSPVSITFTIFTLLFSVSSLAQIKFGAASYFGAGCDGQAASFSPAPDSKSFSILFDEMSLISNKRLAYKSCTILVPVDVSEGFKVSINDLDVRGFMHLSAKARGGVGVRARFFNSDGQRLRGAWAQFWQTGEKNEAFTQTLSDAKLSGFCGQNTTQWMIIDTFVGAAVRSRSTAADPASAPEQMVTLDSVDGTSSVNGTVSLELCPVN
jgi:hypothetical protein